MICQQPKCGGKLRVSHSHGLDTARTQRLVCTKCRRSYTAVTVVREYTGRGSGAKAMAARLRQQLHDHDPAERSPK